MKLHPNGLATLHIDDQVYKPGKDGMFDVATHHVEHALAHGATRHDPNAVPAAPAAPAGDLQQRVATLENTLAGMAPRLLALEQQLAELAKKKGQ